MNRRGKITALSTGAVGVVLLGAAGLAAKDRIGEEYWLWRLQNGDPASQGLAAMHLGDLRSVRAVPVLVAGLVETYLAWSDPEPGRWAYYHIALIKIGKPAVLELLKSWRQGGDDSEEACYRSSFAIYSFRREGQVSEPDGVHDPYDLFLQFLSNDCSQPPEVRQLAAEILEKRQAK